MKQVEKKNERIVIVNNGPYLVSGKVPLAQEVAIRDKKNVPADWKLGETYPEHESYSLCRCGASKNKPYCDGSHANIGFDGAETASKRPYSEVAERYEGAELVLLDQKELCAGAQFCHRAGGVWDLAENAAEPKDKQLAIEIVGQCPTGRLVVCEKSTGKSLEPHFKKTIAVLEDPGRHCSGPLWVKGGIPIQSSDGTEYEVRNRVTLCRCGQSDNKPFCDGTHIDIGFKDSD